MLQDKALSSYLDELASASPTPGGGAAAALTVAQSAALLSMVCNLTMGKKAFVAVAEETRKLHDELVAIKSKALVWAEEDMAVFERVMTAYKLPKASEREMADRDIAIEASLKTASEIPFALFDCCLKLFPIAQRLKAIGNPQLLSDVEVALLLAHAGIESSRVNVQVNLDGIKDASFCETKLRAMKKYPMTVTA